MANLRLLSLSLGFLFLFHACVAQLELPQQQFWQKLQQQQQHRLRAKTQCRVQNLNAREPTYRYQSEAGFTEFWEANSEEFECAGVEFVRHVIEPRGLLLPYYSNAPKLAYIVQGSGIQGQVIPGCAETYESEQSFSGYRGEEEGQRSADRHQKLRRFRQGDIIALPPGVTNWVYNDGDTPIMCVSLIDVANENNQLDLQYRKFFLAGNPQSAESSQGEGERGSRFRAQGQQQQRNIFNGFDQALLAEVFNVDQELIRRLQGQEENRGVIVRAEKLRLNVPEYGREEQERDYSHQGRRGGYPVNGLEETFCTIKMRENIDHPTRADIYNPRGGRLKTVNSQTLPILAYLRLNAERGVLYRNAVMSPHWSTNAHAVLYVTRGSARIQVVGNRGQSVFDEVVRQNQLIIIPQNFVAIKRASDEGFEWVSFKTNDNAVTNQLAGRLSAIRSMPVEVLMNAYGLSRENARSLKYNRDEATLFSPSSRSAGGGYVAP